MKPPKWAIKLIFDINSETKININITTNNCIIIFLLKVLLKYIIVKIAPIRPKMAPLAPTDIVLILKDNEAKFPNNPEIK